MRSGSLTGPAFQPAELTPFQSLMKEWAALAPYNFVHAIRFASPVDIERWQAAVDAVVRKIGLTNSANRTEKLSDDMEAHLQAELLRPFSETDAPIRFFVTASGYWAGATINHWFADDFSCRLLLGQIYATYREEVLTTEMSVGPPASRRAVAGRWWRNWTRFVKQAIEMRRACRTPVRDPIDFGVRIFRAVLPEGAVEAGRTLARRHHATLHDLFLAATSQAFSAARGLEPGTPRDRVAIASAMDLRRFDAKTEPNGFGFRIGHYIISESRPHERSLGHVIESVAAQTRRFKSDSETDPHQPALFLWRLGISRRSKATHYLRGAPLVAGLSNVNLTGSWIEQSEICEYRRLGPTGPIVPMVIMITTLRGRIFFDVTFRTAAFTELEAKTLVNEIVQRLPDRLNKA